jgi:hypothetical protein
MNGARLKVQDTVIVEDAEAAFFIRLCFLRGGLHSKIRSREGL